MSRYELQLLPPATKREEHFHHLGRFIHGALLLGKDCLHLIGLYGFTNAERDRTQRLQNEDLLSVACEAVAKLGNEATLIVGDLNTSTDASTVLQTNLQAGVLEDFAWTQARLDGSEPENTCYVRETSKGSRIDHILANSVASLGFQGFDSVPCDAPTHKATRCLLQLHMCAKQH